MNYPDHCLTCGEAALDASVGVYPCLCLGTREGELTLRAWRADRERHAAWRASLPGEYRAYAEARFPKDAHLANGAAVSAALGLKSGAFLYLWGPGGRGKTHLACRAVERLVAEGGFTARFASETTYFEQVFAEFKGGPPAPDLTRPDVLIYDDFGKQKPSEFALQRLYHMLEGRWSRGLTTVITSNFKPSAVAQRLTDDRETGQAVLSRLVSGGVYEFVGARDARVGRSAS